MPDSLYIAVDLGAGSGRVFLADLAPEELFLDEVHRFYYPASIQDGHLRWDLPAIFEEIKHGLRAAGTHARRMNRRIQSIGVDSWGVDYGLIDDRGALIELPVCYRDQRTDGAMTQVFSIVSRAEIFARTGIQFLVFNTLFQLFAQAHSGISATATRLLLIPDLINFLLTGRAVTEFTNATTTQMVNAASGRWDFQMMDQLSLPHQLLAEIIPAGTEIGFLKAKLAEGLGLEGVRVVAPATHDTGSAVAGAPLKDDWAYISSGTWSLVGVERDQVLVNAEVERHNFTNEGGAFGTIRFLKNVMGLWILESCRREWEAGGLDVDYESLLPQVSQLKPSPALIFPDDGRFLNPPSMIEALCEHLRENDQVAPENPTEMTKVILDSLALRYASVLRTIESLTGRKIPGVHIVGGGSRNHYLNQATANACGLTVLAGPVEATVIGNVLVQAVAAGRFASLKEARREVARNLELRSFHPQEAARWSEATRRYAAIEARYVS